MIDDELPVSLQSPPKGPAALGSIVREDLDPYSVEDLEDRIGVLEGEIRRAREAVERKKIVALRPMLYSLLREVKDY